MPAKSTLSRNRKRAEMGEEAYKAAEALKKKEYRARKKAEAEQKVQAEQKVEQKEEKKEIERKTPEPAIRQPIQDGMAQHLTRIRNFYNKVYKKEADPDWDGTFEFLNQFKKNIKLILDKYENNNTRASYFESFARVLYDSLDPKLKKLNEKYKNVADLYKNLAKTKSLDNKVGPDEKIIPWGSFKNLYKDEPIGSKRKMLLSLLTFLPPRRTADYSNLVIRDKDAPMSNDFNYIDMGRKTISYNNYKTKANYGNQSFVLPTGLYRQFDAYVKFNKLKPNDYVFGNYKNPSAEFKKLLAGLTMNSIRHSFISDFLAGNPDTKNRKAVADLMAHAIGTQLEYDRRELQSEDKEE
jgi:hypothetical protein